MKNFQYRDTIGAGACGVVYLVYDPQYKTEFALKTVVESKFNQNEVDCMKQVDDPNVIRLYHYDYYKGCVYMVMEYCATSLEKAVIKKNGLPYNLLRKYSIGVLKAVRACHNAKIAHKDIKPVNFLIDFYDRIRVCDFGLSSIHSGNEPDQVFVGFVPFMPPEILLRKPHDAFEADIWAIGVTFFIMATGRLPWSGDNRSTICQNLLNFEPRLDLIEDKVYADVVRLCLSKNPDNRPTIHDLLSLSIFKEVQTIIQKHPRRAQLLNSSRIGYFSQASLIIPPKQKRAKLVQSF